MIVRALLLVLAAVLASGCDLLDETFDEVRQEHGVDLRDPLDAARAVSGAEATGNTEAADGLKAMKGFRRAEHEQRGDLAFRRDDYVGAISEYDEALRWSQRSAEGDVIAGIGSVLGLAEAPRPDPAYERQLSRKRSELHVRKAFAYQWQAQESYDLGRFADARRYGLASADEYEIAAAELPDADAAESGYLGSARAMREWAERQ